MPPVLECFVHKLVMQNLYLALRKIYRNQDSYLGINPQVDHLAPVTKDAFWEIRAIVEPVSETTGRGRDRDHAVVERPVPQGAIMLYRPFFN
jgi:hypothetical protein